MSDRPPLEAEIRRRIAAAGPMPVNEYMTLCLTDSEHGPEFPKLLLLLGQAKVVARANTMLRALEGT